MEDVFKEKHTFFANKPSEAINLMREGNNYSNPESNQMGYPYGGEE